MRLAVLSDLHLCSDPRCAEVAHSESQLLRFLDGLEATHDVLVLAGDVYNLDHSRLPCAPMRELRATQRRFPRLTARLAGPPYVQVAGNHDRALTRNAVPHSVTLDCAGVRVLVVHGHEADSLVKRLPIFAPMGSWVAAWLRRTGLDRAADGLVRVGFWVNKLPTRWRAPNSERSAPRHEQLAATLLANEDVDVVIQGHRHSLTARHFPALGLYANGGNCSFGKLRYASLELGVGEATSAAERDAPRHHSGDTVMLASRGGGGVAARVVLFDVGALSRWRGAGDEAPPTPVKAPT